ncbi:mariner Mos1 transposase [Trichonephila clavipes]|nr:mariner Mos1 transposase [Trichonephila clavipes]
MLENNPHLTIREIAEEFGIHHTTVGDHIKSLGFVLKRSVWVPHGLTKKNLSDHKGPLYYELLKQGKTINAELYCNPLDKLKAVIKEKRPALASRKGIVFHHDNARTHTAMLTQQKLNALGWKVLGHPPYTPDIAPSDYYLLKSLQNYLTGKKFKSFESISKAVAEYFNSKDENFLQNRNSQHLSIEVILFVWFVSTRSYYLRQFIFQSHEIHLCVHPNLGDDDGDMPIRVVRQVMLYGPRRTDEVRREERP